MKIVDIMEPIDFLNQFYPVNSVGSRPARVTTFADGTIVVCPHDPKQWYDTPVVSAAKANGTVRIMSNMPCKIEDDDGK